MSRADSHEVGGDGRDATSRGGEGGIGSSTTSSHEKVGGESESWEDCFNLRVIAVPSMLMRCGQTQVVVRMWLSHPMQTTTSIFKVFPKNVLLLLLGNSLTKILHR